jgi:hypothetical protein
MFGGFNEWDTYRRHKRWIKNACTIKAVSEPAGMYRASAKYSQVIFVSE